MLYLLNRHSGVRQPSFFHIRTKAKSDGRETRGQVNSLPQYPKTALIGAECSDFCARVAFSEPNTFA
jgi:hypothetical protein